MTTQYKGNIVIVLQFTMILCHAVEYKVGDEINGTEIQRAYEENNNEKLRLRDAYSTTLIVDDINSDKTNDMIIENVIARGVTGNRSFGVFLGINGSDKYRYIGETGSIARIIKYENGHVYILESSNAGGGHYVFNLTMVRDAMLRSAGSLEISPKEDVNGEDAQGQLVYLLREVCLSEDRLLQIVKKQN